MSDESKDKKCAVVALKLSKEILNGKYGQSGDRFLSVRNLAKEMKISLVTAQQAMTLLKERGLITIFGNAYYLTTGRLSARSPLYRLMNSKMYFPHECPLIGIHLIDIDNPFFSALLMNVITVVRRYGYMPIIMCSDGNSNTEKHILRDFIAMGVKGVLSCPNFDTSLLEVYGNYILPVVFLAHRFDVGGIEYTLANDTTASSHAVEHLLHMGYENFMYFGLDDTKNDDARLNAFADALQSRGYSLPEENIILLPKDFKIPFTTQKRIQQSAKPLGIFCYHDLIAIQVLMVCDKLGVPVPQDAGVIGFDDLPIASQCSPTLTTIAYRLDQMAESAVSQLIRSITSPNKIPNCSYEYINYVLQIRQSTARGMV